MASLDLSAAVFDRLPPIEEGQPFESAFPSSDAVGAPRWKALSKADPGALVQAQSNAWQSMMHLSMRELTTSAIVGGYPAQVISEIIPEGVNMPPAFGVFASARFPATADDLDDLTGAAIRVGLDVLDSVLSGFPVVGGMLSSALGIGVWIAGLVRGSDVEIILTVPWAEYSRDTDTDIVNTFLLRRVSPSSDWTNLFRPTLDYSVLRGFTVEETTKGGNTRAFGVFSPDTGEPKYTAGYGFMPGTAQMGDVVQVARVSGAIGAQARDAVTNVGDYLPTVGQYGQQAWGQVNKIGSPDAFKVRPSELADEWSDYWDAYFADGFAQIDSYRRGKSNKAIIYALFAAKALGRFIVAGGHLGLAPEFLATVGSLDSAAIGVHPEMFDNPDNRLHKGTIYKRPDTAYILPALRACMKRQKRALATTTVAAYVRPEGDDAFGAFLDEGPPLDSSYDTWGDELRAFCVDVVRPAMLTHGIRFKVDNATALEVDPEFGADIVESKAGMHMPPTLSAGPLAPAIAAIPAIGGGGGVPFAIPAVRPVSRTGKIAAGVAGGVLVAGALGGAAYVLTR